MSDFNHASRRSFITASAATMAAYSSQSLLAQKAKKKRGKKGLSIIARKPEAKKVLSDLKADWFYAWGGRRPEGVAANIKFTPMVFGYWGQNAKIKEAAKIAKEAGIENLLGFNEPDRKKQGNTSVEKALKGWRVMMETGMRLGSPSCVHPDGEWMKEFMEKAKKQKLKVDFVCMHSYGSTNADSFLRRVEKVHRMFKKPVWITEFACGDWNAKSPAQNKHKPDKVLKFMEKVFSELDRRDYVERYAWFPAGQNNNALATSALYDSKFRLTKLGRFYRDHES